jgi:hypothetical protein
MIESICIGHFILAGVLVGVFFLAGCIIKPVPLPVVMSPAEESQFDLMQTDAQGNTLVIQMKEGVHHGSKQEALSCHQESSALSGD